MHRYRYCIAIVIASLSLLHRYRYCIAIVIASLSLLHRYRYLHRYRDRRESMETYYIIKQDNEYRAEGNNLFPKENGAFVCTSALIPFKKGTMVVIEKLNINEFHPDMFRAYVPSMGVSIAAISMNDVCLATTSDTK